MSITLAEAKVGMADKVDQMVVDEFRRNSVLLDNLTFDNCISPGTGGSTLTYGYMQLLTPSTAAVRSINHEYTAGEAKKTKKTADAVPMGGAFEIDRVLQNTSGAVDELAFQAQQKIKATANYFDYVAINGTSAGSGAGYVVNTIDGLKKLLHGTANVFTSEVDVSTAALLDANGNALLDELDAMIASVAGGVKLLLMNRKMFLKIRAAARRAGYYDHTVDGFGRNIETYNGIPMVDMGQYYNGETSVDVVADTAATSEAEGTSTVYAINTDLDGFIGISPEGTGVVSSYMPDMTAPGAVKKGEVELVAGVALKNTLKAAALTGVKTSPKTA